MDEGKNKLGIIKTITKNRGPFLLYFIIVLVLTFSVLYFFGLVPDALKSTVGRESVLESKGNRIGELPLTIKIPIIGVDSEVYNPATTSAEVLDNYLLKGAVRYPGSGLLGGDGNIFIFGHNTGIPIVNNQAFKTFNGLKNLKAGDLIQVFSDKYEYDYKVTSLKMVGADKAFVEFNTKSEMLTISTCNNFGAKSDRYVVESVFVSKKVIQN